MDGFYRISSFRYTCGLEVVDGFVYRTCPYFKDLIGRSWTEVYKELLRRKFTVEEVKKEV